jgi:hypothetical protein
MKNFGSVLIALFGLAGQSYANQVEHVEPVFISGTWVDACVDRYGFVDCSQDASNTAAFQFCTRERGGDVNWVKWQTSGASGNHSTFRYTYWNDGGTPREGFVACDGCSSHFDFIDCELPF